MMCIPDHDWETVAVGRDRIRRCRNCKKFAESDPGALEQAKRREKLRRIK